MLLFPVLGHVHFVDMNAVQEVRPGMILFSQTDDPDHEARQGCHGLCFPANAHVC